MLTDAFDRLMQGEDGKAIVATLRTHYSKHSVKTHVLGIKKKVLLAGYRHPHFEQTASALRKHEGENEEIAEFLQSSPFIQLQVQKRHRKIKTWSKGAEAKLAKIKILPDNLKSFKITKRESEDIMRDVRVKRRERMDEVLRIPKAGDLLDLARVTLENATVKTNYAALCCSLALVCGRRSCELLNQRSKFTVNGTHTVLFVGQLKKAHGESKPYTIPILVDPHLFVRAMAVLCQKQGDVTHLTNEQVNDKYNGNLTPARIATFMPGIPKFHFLRTLYSKFVDHCFDHTKTYNKLACEILGHTNVEMSLSYCGAQLEDIDHLRRTFGPLKLDA